MRVVSAQFSPTQAATTDRNGGEDSILDRGGKEEEQEEEQEQEEEEEVEACLSAWM